MPEIQKHTPGSFCWAEIGAIDPDRSKAFYSELFGWTYEDRPAGPFGVYTMCRSKGKDVAGLYRMPPELLKRGVPPHWMSYVAVGNAEEACKAVQKNGGQVQQGPFDVMDAGRMAICQDPTGAVFSVWQAKAHGGMGVLGENGTPCWFELATKGVEKAEAFYKAVFGWSVKADKGADVVYREFSAPGASHPQGGLMERMPHMGPGPSHWTIYFPVQDCDTDAERAANLGGRVLLPPMDIPNVGRFAVLSDPAGASFAIIKLAPELTQPKPEAKPVEKAEKSTEKKGTVKAAATQPRKGSKKK